MGTQTKIKVTDFFKILGNHLGTAFKIMLEDSYDEKDLNEAIKSLEKEDPTSKEYLSKFKEVAELSEKALKKEEERFDNSPRLEDKIGNEKVNVDIEAAKKSGKAVEMEDKQRIR